MADNKPALAPGYYVGIFQTPVNFRLDEPKITSAQEFVGTFEDLFNEYRTPNSRKSQKSSRAMGVTEKGTITTQSSGWILAVDSKGTKAKAIAAPEIYKASGGADPALGDEAVARFKRYAAQQLAANVGKRDDEVRAVIRDINKYACYVFEVRVKLLRVDTKPFEGGRRNGDRYFGEVLLRKFYSTEGMCVSLIDSFAKAIADPSLTINGTNHLVIAKRDGTPNRSNQFRDRSQFSIRGATSYDSDIIKVLEYLKNRNEESRRL